MAKIMVAINIPDKTYDELREEVIKKHLWTDSKTGKVGIQAKYLDIDDEICWCELIGVVP